MEPKVESDPKVERHARNCAFLAALAEAAGDDELAQSYEDSMMRAWMLLRPLDVRVIYGA